MPRCDMAIAGGFDLTMDALSYVKFSKIGARSADTVVRSTPKQMGLSWRGWWRPCPSVSKTRSGWRLDYAKVLGVGAASDGRGRLNRTERRGQRLSLERATRMPMCRFRVLGLSTWNIQ